MSKKATNKPSAERSREKSRSRVLRGKGGNQASHTVGVAKGAQERNQKAVGQSLMPSDVVKVGYAMRGARKALNIKRK